MGGSVNATIDGQTRLMGLIGEHIGYTLSPGLHNATLPSLGINAVYLPLPLPAAQVEPFLSVAWHLGAIGFNVTTPHKELVARLVPGGDGRPLPSVNTVYRGPTSWLAASTDGPGFGEGLRRLGRELESFDHVVFLGAGGAVAAIVAHLYDRHRAAAPLSAAWPKVTILRRGPGRDAALRALAPEGAPLAFAEATPLALAAALTGQGSGCLFVQATSAPHQGDDLSAFVPALTFFDGIVVDLVYAKPSALLRSAATKGLLAQDGEAMLIEQARAAQRLWFGKAASPEELCARMPLPRQ